MVCIVWFVAVCRNAVRSCAIEDTYGVQISGGLIKKEDGRLVGNRTCDGDSLLLSSREHVGHVVKPLTHPDSPKQHHCPPASFLSCQLACEDHRQHDILHCTQGGQQIESLKYKS